MSDFWQFFSLSESVFFLFFETNRHFGESAARTTKPVVLPKLNFAEYLFFFSLFFFFQFSVKKLKKLSFSLWEKKRDAAGQVFWKWRKILEGMKFTVNPRWWGKWTVRNGRRKIQSWTSYWIQVSLALYFELEDSKSYFSKTQTKK